MVVLCFVCFKQQSPGLLVLHISFIPQPLLHNPVGPLLGKLQILEDPPKQRESSCVKEDHKTVTQNQNEADEERGGGIPHCCQLQRAQHLGTGPGHGGPTPEPRERWQVLL